MYARKFMLSYYRDAAEGLHVQRIHSSVEAQKPHTHAYFQIYYVAQGELEHHLDNSSAVLSRGDMFIIPPSVMHRIRIRGDVQFYTFSFMPEIFGEPGACSAMAIHFLRELEQRAATDIRPAVSTSLEDTLHIENLFKQMLSVFKTKEPGSNALLRAYGNLLVTLLAKNYYESIPDNFFPALKNNKQAVLRGISYIEQNYADPLSLESVARYCAMSRSSFSALFSKVAGKTFQRYLNDCRIQHACDYIRRGYLITGIYGLCGYRDFSTFYRNFKKITGQSPEQFKQSLKT